ncbi:MAG: molybdopterin molybdenumtransferase MoeA, partial [Coriobacteriaceae bacterium]|nr:molybdopterin molybdenumtransferase MoeA [Coriobacteriaceae bacterium]
MREMISPEEARELVLSKVQAGRVVTVDLLDALGRVAAQDVVSDMDVSPFAHSAMDGFALRSQDIAQASEGNPVKLRVIADVPAGSCHEGVIREGECVRIMTGAAVPEEADAVVKYEIVGVEEGDGKAGSLVSFTVPAKLRANIREAGEEAKAGETVLRQGEIVSSAGAGFLASCGSLSIDV